MNNAVWILSSPRTGSTFLRNILNSTKLFDPPFHEHYSHKSQLVPYTKITYPMIKEYFGNEQELKINLKKNFRQIKFIWLTRNIFEKTISSCFVDKTKKSHVYNKEELAEYEKKEVILSDKEMINKYNFLIKNKFYDEIWLNFLENEEFLEVKYNELISNPELIGTRILQFLNLDNIEFNVKSMTFKLNHPNKEIYLAKLKNILNII